MILVSWCLITWCFCEKSHHPNCILQVKGFEYIRGVHLEAQPFDVERDLTTPTFKLKRPQLLKYYQVKIAFETPPLFFSFYIAMTSFTILLDIWEFLLHCISCSFHFQQSQGFQFCGFVLCFAERSWCTLCQHEEAMSFLFYRVQSSVSEIVYKRMSKGQSSPRPNIFWGGCGSKETKHPQVHTTRDGWRVDGNRGIISHLFTAVGSA